MKKANTEIKMGPYTTKVGEFRYSGDDVLVRKDQQYNIFFLKTKNVEYRLSVNDEQIYREKMILLEKYKQAIRTSKRDSYPIESFPTKKDLSFKNKYIRRIFAKNKLNLDGDILEVKTKTNTPSYIFVGIDWQISGPIEEAEIFNKKQLFKAEGKMPGISEKVPVLQLHEIKIDQETSPESLVHKNPLYTGAIAPPPDIEIFKRNRIRKKRKKNRKKFKKGAKVTSTSKIF